MSHCHSLICLTIRDISVLASVRSVICDRCYQNWTAGKTKYQIRSTPMDGKSCFVSSEKKRKLTNIENWFSKFLPRTVFPLADPIKFCQLTFRHTVCVQCCSPLLPHALVQPISPWIKLPPFRRQQFESRFLETKVRISVSLKFVPKGPIDNNQALV